MSTVPTPFVSEAEYLAQERKADHKSQYFRGKVFAMAGASPTSPVRASRQHNLICGNSITTLTHQLRDGDCEVYPSDMKVKVSSSGLYTYPDVSVACERPEFKDENGDVLLNPRVPVAHLCLKWCDFLYAEGVSQLSPG